jgi:hypothetical protein
MFNLSRGILKQLNDRGLINETFKNSSGKNVSKIMLRDFDKPLIVKIMSISCDESKLIIKVKLFDGLDFLDSYLHESLWCNLSDFEHFFHKENKHLIVDEQRISIGTVFILSEYTFKDVTLIDYFIIKDMFMILKYSSIGWDHVYSFKQTNLVKHLELKKVHPSGEFKNLYDGLSKLKDLSMKKEGCFVKTMGVCYKEEDLKIITPKNKSAIKIKNFYICDQSTSEIKVSLWGKQAEEFSLMRGIIYLLLNVKLTNYLGNLALSIFQESSISEIKDDFQSNDGVNSLRKWWREK